MDGSQRDAVHILFSYSLTVDHIQVTLQWRLDMPLSSPFRHTYLLSPYMELVALDCHLLLKVLLTELPLSNAANFTNIISK